MYIDEVRPELYCNKLKVDNKSPNNKVFFLEEGHKYYYRDDVVEGEVKDFDSSLYKFRSPTGLLKLFKEEFDSVNIAKKFVVKHALDITWQQQVKAWETVGDIASEEGSLLHFYAECLWNRWKVDKPVSPKAVFVDALVALLSKDYTLVKTELLVYSNVLRIAGQVDLLLKHKKTEELALMDYKFIKESLKKKSFFNPRTRKYKMMYGPFRFLFDIAYYHYSIQMVLYRYLMGAFGKKVTSLTLLVVTPEGFELEKGYPIKIWIDSGGFIQASYIKPLTKQPYNSTKDKVYMNNKIKVV